MIDDETPRQGAGSPAPHRGTGPGHPADGRGGQDTAWTSSSSSPPSRARVEQVRSSCSPGISSLRDGRHPLRQRARATEEDGRADWTSSSRFGAVEARHGQDRRVARRLSRQGHALRSLTWAGRRARSGVPGVNDAAAVILPPSAPPSGADPDRGRLPALRTAVAAAGYTVPEEIAATPAAADRERGERSGRPSAPPPPVVGAALSLPVLLGSMPTVFPWAPALCRNPWVLLALTHPVQFWVGWPFHAAFLKEVRHRSASMNALVSDRHRCGLRSSAWPSRSGLHRFMATGADAVLRSLRAADHLPRARPLARGARWRRRVGRHHAAWSRCSLAHRPRAAPGRQRVICTLRGGGRSASRPSGGARGGGWDRGRGASSVDESMLTGEKPAGGEGPGRDRGGQLR